MAKRHRAWNRAVVSIEGPITEGATISLVSIVNPKRTFKLKVTEMTPPNRMVWGDSMPWAWLSGPLSGLIVRTIPDMTDSFDQFADGLKTAAEATPRRSLPPIVSLPTKPRSLVFPPGRV